MIKKFLATFGLGPAADKHRSMSEFYEPYAEPHANFLYNLLFCDDIDLFKNENTVTDDDLWSPLLEEAPDPRTLRQIARDETNDARVRAIAFNRLRAQGQSVPSRRLLGVIIEVPLDQGLDVLAAFADGGVRYLNQSGKVSIFEGAGHPLEELAKEFIAISQPVLAQIGPWDKKRLPPPRPGRARMTFLVSDGLYFGEGPFDALQSDPVGGPVLAKATQLLQLVVKAGIE